MAVDALAGLTEAIQQLGLTDTAAALKFFQDHPADDFKTLRVAVKLPPRPAYYSAHMDLSIVVDRGDVWYDLPIDSQGRFNPVPRRKYPSLTLYTTHARTAPKRTVLKAAA